MGVLEIAVNAPGRGVRNTGGLIIEPRTPRNHVPKFQAKFGVAEEEPDGHAVPRVGINKKSPLGKGASSSTYVLRDIYLIVAEITSQ